MNKEYWIRFLAIALCLSIVLGGVSNTAHGQVQFPRSYTIGIFRLPQIDGSTKFELSVPGSSLTEIVHLPNGESVTNPFPNPRTQLGHFVFNSVSELKSALVGEWTLEIPMSGGRPHEEYTFEISDFPESTLFAISPNIVSPTNGSLVPPEFAMMWAWPPGITPPNRSATLTKRFGPGSRLSYIDNVRASNELSSEITAEHTNGDLAQRLELRAGSHHPDVLADFVSEVTPQQNPSRYTYTIRSPYFNHSTPIEVFVVVPEPATWMLLMCAATLLFGRRYC
jgi:hypothetical protein